MRKSVSRWTGLVALVVLAVTAVPAWSQATASAPQDSVVTSQAETGTDDSGYELGLYMWLAGLDGTMGFGPAKDVAVDAKFTDLASYLDFSMAGYFEARRPKFIIGADLFWVKLGATRSAHIDGANVDVDLNMDQYVGALGGAYRLTPQVELWLTGRLYSMQTSQTFQGSAISSNRETWGDVYVGARYHVDFARRWTALARADIGTGGSNLAWYGNLAVGYHFTPTFTLGAAYRVLSLDREDNGDPYFKYDIVEDGLGIIANFSLK